MHPSSPAFPSDSATAPDADVDTSGQGDVQPFAPSLESATERSDVSPTSGRRSTGGQTKDDGDARRARESGRKGKTTSQSGTKAGSKEVSSGKQATSENATSGDKQKARKGGKEAASKKGGDAGKTKGSKKGRGADKAKTSKDGTKTSSPKNAKGKGAKNAGTQASKRGAKGSGNRVKTESGASGNAQTSSKEASGKDLGGRTQTASEHAKSKAKKGGSQRSVRRRVTRGTQQGATDAGNGRGKGDKILKTGSQAEGRNAPSSGGGSSIKEGPSRTTRRSVGTSVKGTSSSKGGVLENGAQQGGAKSQSKSGAQTQSKAKTGRSSQQSSNNSGQQSGGQSKHNRGDRQGSGSKKGKKAPVDLRTQKAPSRGGRKSSLGRSASPSDLFPGGGTGTGRGGQGWTSAVKGGRAGASSGPPRTLPTAWLKTATNGPMKAKQMGKGWKAMEVALGDKKGKMTVQARSNSESMNVSVRFSEGRLRAQMAANARQLQETMQAQYGSDVDLSFAGGNPDGSERQASDGSIPERRSAPSSSTESSDEGTENGMVHRRRPNGENEWIG